MLTIRIGLFCGACEMSKDSFFYLNGKLQACFSSKHAVIIFRQRAGLLAARNPTITALLPIDCSGSVLASGILLGGYERCYTCYGFAKGVTHLGYAGEKRDPWTECYVLGNGYRMFSPVLMRFLSPDSYSPFTRGLFNAYIYCGGDPINNVDPSGHKPMFSFGKPRVRAHYRASDPANALADVVGYNPRRQIIDEARFQDAGYSSDSDAPLRRGAYMRRQPVDNDEGYISDEGDASMRHQPVNHAPAANGSTRAPQPTDVNGQRATASLFLSSSSNHSGTGESGPSTSTGPRNVPAERRPNLSIRRSQNTQRDAAEIRSKGEA